MPNNKEIMSTKEEPTHAVSQLSLVPLTQLKPKQPYVKTKSSTQTHVPIPPATCALDLGN